jgi:membrane-anchored protein YejM (alkaline phosphatase superfamily)
VVPNYKLFRILGVLASTTGLTVLLLDTQAYQELNLHLNPIVWELLLSSDKNAINAKWQYLFVLVPVIFIFQLVLAEWVWRKQRKLSHKRVGRSIAGVFIISFLFSHLIYIWADATFYNPITNQRANFPLSYPMTAKSFLERQGWLDREEYRQRVENGEAESEVIKYPVEELQINNAKSQNYNLLMIVVDNLRADRLTSDTMPSLTDFAAQNQNFTQHYSSGNDSLAAFGLFYGIPATYSANIRHYEKQPLFLEQLQYRNYKLGFFSGNNFESSIYTDTILSAHKENLILAKNPTDQQAIVNWQSWLESNQDTWFSLIQLNNVTHFDDNIEEGTTANAEQLLSQAYNKAATQVDNSIARILNTLEEKQWLQNTVVVITSDNGWEFNETKTNSWGSGSNYSKYQLQVPMVIHWPNKPAQNWQHTTSHFDLSVSLMQDLLGVTSNPYDFSSGKNLFDSKQRRWTLAGDAREFALISQNETTVLDRYGNYKVFDLNYRRQREAKPKLSIIMQGLSETKRFYEQN